MTLIDVPNALLIRGMMEAGEDPGRAASKVTGGSVRLRLGDTRISATPGEIQVLADAWTEIVRSHDRGHLDVGLRAIVSDASSKGRDLVLQKVLEADGIEAAYLVDSHLVDRRDFQWPARVAVAASGIVEDALREYHHADLLVGPQPIAAQQAYDIVFATLQDVDVLVQAEVSAGLVVLFVSDPSDVNVDSAAQIARSIEASAVCVSQRPLRVRNFVTALFDNISHDLPLDVACARAVGAGEVPGNRWAMIGLPSYIEAAKVRSTLARMRTHVERLHGADALSPGAFADLFGRLRVVETLGIPEFYAESDGATKTVKIGREIEHELAAAHAEPDTAPDSTAGEEHPRQLQAQVFTREAGGLSQRKRSFAPDTPHRINIRVGRSTLDWLAVSEPFPAWKLSPNERFHELDVHVLAPGVFEGVRQKSIVIGPSAESTIAEIDVDIPKDLANVTMLVSVWRGAVHLQSARLEGQVTVEDVERPGSGLRFVTDEASNADLDCKHEPDLAILWQDGQNFMKRKGEAELVPLQGISGTVSTMRATLFQIATRVEGLTIGLEDAEVLPHLRTLAAQGESLRRDLLGDTAQDVKTVEITTPSSGDFWPVEFFYDHGIPEDGATLCSSFAGSTGCTCQNCEAEQDASKICLSGFWTLNKVIQRQVKQPQSPAGHTQPEISETCDCLPKTKDIVFAASNEVNTRTDPQRVVHTIQHLRDLQAVVHPATSWQQWQTHVSEHSPALLLALPHNVQSATKFPALQIEADQNLAYNRINPQHVAPDGQHPGPLVMLLGCNTANPEEGYQDFIHKMRSSGASFVVGTLSYVLGPQAARLAEVLVEALWEADSGDTIGELITGAKAKLLRENNPMALAIIGFGDAHWKVN